jgi:hypothetical protein
MTTLMRNGRDRRLGEPVQCHATTDKRVLLIGTRSADYIRASSQSGCIDRPNTWLHPNASLRSQIPLATRAPSIHGTSLVPPDSCRGCCAAEVYSPVPVAAVWLCCFLTGRTDTAPAGRRHRPVHKHGKPLAEHCRPRTMSKCRPHLPGRRNDRRRTACVQGGGRQTGGGCDRDRYRPRS